MKQFKFGLEAEFLVARPSTWKPLWHQEVSFRNLNSIFEGIPTDGIPELAGLEIEPPHGKLMSYVVEGYHVLDQDFNAVDIKPKGVEIRTPVCGSIDECLDVFRRLYGRLQNALAKSDLVAVSLSHHPVASRFEGPQNKRRYDFWQWAMEVMTTYGPDINVGLPEELRGSFDIQDFEAKIDHYGPALAALSVGSPFLNGEPWSVRGRVGHSFRMHKRSVVAPSIEFHPHENWRLEFKAFDMPESTLEFKCQFLCFLALLLTPGLKGRANRQTRVYDLGQVARHGINAEGVGERLTEFFRMASGALAKAGFDPSALGFYRERMLAGRTPADHLVDVYNREGMEGVLRSRSEFLFNH